MNSPERFDSIEGMVEYIEKEYNVKVLALRDYGSRAWNLDSETSDMDAGMLFRQPAKCYFTLSNYRQNIDRKFFVDGEEFELIGWNVKRFGELLNKSNPSMIEWLNSDIHYYHDTVFIGARVKVGEDTKNLLEDLKDHANQNFKPISLFYHYRSMAKDNYKKYIENQNDLSVKRHLYILRGLTYARYVEKTHRMPPLDYVEFYENELNQLETVPSWVKEYIGSFIEKKKNGNGNKTIVDEELHDWIGEELDEHLDNEQHDVRGIDKEKVNNFIKSVIP